MSAADVGIGDPSAPRQNALARVQAWAKARAQAYVARLGAAAARLLAQDDSALAAWVAAQAAAPQAVPNLPRPPNKRLTGFVVGFVVGAHLALLAVLYWRSAPPPPPEAEMTVELVHDMPEAATAKPPEGKPEQKPPQPPVQEGTSAEHEQTTQQQAKPEQQSAKSEQHQAKQEPKPEQKSEARAQPKAEAKPARREAHRASPPKSEQKEQAQQKALEAKAQELQKAQEELKQAQEQQRQERQQQEQQQALASQAPRGPGLDMPAIALPGTSDAGTESVSYPQLVLSQVAKAKKEGRYMGVPGYAGVRFRVAEDGSLESVKLVASSGDPNLDIEAEAMIRRAAPFPKPPPGGRRDYGITLVFKPQP